MCLMTCPDSRGARNLLSLAADRLVLEMPPRNRVRPVYTHQGKLDICGPLSTHEYQSRTSTYDGECAAVPRRARIQGAETFVSLNSRLENNKEEEHRTRVGKLTEKSHGVTSRGGFRVAEWIRLSHHPGGNPGANWSFLQSTSIQVPPESGGICGIVDQDLPLGYLQGGHTFERSRISVHQQLHEASSPSKRVLATEWLRVAKLSVAGVTS